MTDVTEEVAPDTIGGSVCVVVPHVCRVVVAVGDFIDVVLNAAASVECLLVFAVGDKAAVIRSDG